MTTACDTVANTDNSPPYILSPTRSKKSRVVAVAFFLLFGSLAVASLYKLGPWTVPAVRIASPSLSVSTPLQTGTKEPAVLNNETATETTTETAMPPGKYSVGYFVNWGIYGRKFPPSSIPAQDLTHILYAFANIRPNTGEVFLSDLWADQDIHYPGDSWSDSGTNLYGNFKAIYELKKRHRHLKLLLSIGGWTYSPSFHPVVVSPAHRAEFVRSAVSLVEDYGLDGLDVDYEYPQNDAQARGYVELLRELRAALDEHARRKYADYRFLLTIAAPCGPDNYHKLHIREMVPLLDFWNLMAYDFSGSWDKVANHQANMFGGPISASQAVEWYISRGVPRHRVILGVPLYGRSFLHTDGPGTPFSGLGQGSWESGVYDYRALPLPGSYILRDERVMASWTYDYVHKEMISYDDEVVGRWKGEYIAQEGLGGSMFWELSGDKGGASREGMEGGHGKEGQPGRSLVRVVKDAMGKVDTQPNWLQYEGSKFENLRKGM
ncbi:glycoside hydrolase family 18 protein [Lactarius hengduanensis]|nr:glycoside hydrolase family 18 protein [Lactarius hengduanensis]